MRAEAFDLADDLASFVHDAWKILEPVTPLSWNWHHDLICEYLTIVKEGRFKERFGSDCEGIIFNVPPRTMKSLLVTVFFPIWVWTSDPAKRWMFASYAEKLSTQHSIFRRNVIDSPWYQERWGHVFRFAKDQNLKTHYTNSSAGQMFSTSMTGATGFGADLLVVDDPLNPEQALSETERTSVNVKFDSVFRSRINSQVSGVKIIVMQRLAEDDLTGHILEKEKDRWIHVKVPATAETDEKWTFPISGRVLTRKVGDLLWPERFPKESLEGLKLGLGSWAFAGQYQQNAAPLEGGLIKTEWIRYYRDVPAQFEQLCASWDCTFKDTKDSDFVAGTLWARYGAKYLMLPFRVNRRMDFGPTLVAAKAWAAKFPSAVTLIEDKANGSAIISELRKEVPGVVAIEPYGGKLARAQAMAPLWESFSVELPDPQFFDGRDDSHPDVRGWIEDYIHNICTFPKAAHDDDMDSTSQALNWMRVNSFGLLEVWKAAALAAKKAQEPKTQTEQEVIQDMAKAQLKEAALSTPAAETMQALTGNSLGLLPKKQEAKKLSGCPKCGAVAIARYADFEKCNCGWDSRQPA